MRHPIQLFHQEYLARMACESLGEKKYRQVGSVWKKLKPEWAEAFDAKTGKSYFYHLKSGITSWSAPGNYAPLTTNRKRRMDEVKVTNNQSKRARKTGSKIERSLLQGSSNNFDNLTSMATVAQSDVLSAVDIDSSQMTSLTTTQEPRLRVQK